VLAGIGNRVEATIHGRNAAWIDQDETHDRVSQHDFKDSPPEFSVTVKTRHELESSRACDNFLAEKVTAHLAAV
jgi:hypothetical protein